MHPLILGPLQPSPITLFAAAVFVLPAIYLIFSSIRDKEWMQLGFGSAFLGFVIFLIGYRLPGGVILVAGLVLGIGWLVKTREEQQEFGLD